MSPFSFLSSVHLTQRIQSLRDAEASLLDFAKSRFSPPFHPLTAHDESNHDWEIIDTPITPPSIFRNGSSCQVFDDQDAVLKLHGVKVVNKRMASDVKQQPAPLVLLHGYANGSLYFYRNLMGLSHFHFGSIYALDMLGWGLSSRPTFDLQLLGDDNGDTNDDKRSNEHKQVASAEHFFVESLESWRKQHDLPKIILAGHSMGGYLSVAYAEKYPQHVERLILLSPVGVPERKEEDGVRINSLPFYMRGIVKITRYLFEKGVTPGSFLRALPLSKSKSMVDSYILNRLPAIQCEEERKHLSEYLYQNSMLPGSGEYCLSQILTAGAFARIPLVDRIPEIKSNDNKDGMEVHFVYGENDWMDFKGGIDVQRLCFNKRTEWEKQKNNNESPPPKVFLHGVRNAGHLLMLDNYEEFNSALIIAAGGEDRLPSNFPRPVEFVCNEVAASISDSVNCNVKREVLNEMGASAFFRGSRWDRRLQKKDEEGVNNDAVDDNGCDEKKMEEQLA